MFTKDNSNKKPVESPPYLDLLESTEAAAREAPDEGSPEEAAALARFSAFFQNMDPDQVARTAREVYAADAWLYDTLVLHHGLESIEPYFVRTAERAAGVRVEILDVLRKGPDFYVKWIMDIEWSAFRKGTTTRSFGMSHLRFNREGRVILHYDFWDSTNGFFEHLPVIGRILKWIKRKAGRA